MNGKRNVCLFFLCLFIVVYYSLTRRLFSLIFFWTIVSAAAAAAAVGDDEQPCDTGPSSATVAVTATSGVISGRAKPKKKPPSVSAGTSRHALRDAGGRAKITRTNSLWDRRKRKNPTTATGRNVGPPGVPRRVVVPGSRRRRRWRRPAAVG